MRPTADEHFHWTETGAGPALVCRALEPLAAHLFTTRSWSLGSARRSDDPAAWSEVAAAVGVDGERLVRVHQMHAADIVVVRRRDGPGSQTSADPRRVRQKPAADIVLSNDPSVALAIQTADCVALLVADRRTGAVAAAHAGWRGLAARVPALTVDALAREFASDPVDLVAAVGPSISAARYEVGVDVRTEFQRAGWSASDLEQWFSAATRPGHWHFDLWQAARDQLDAAGVARGRIHVAALCTATHAGLLCSYRRDGRGAGRIAGVIRARAQV